MEGLKPNSLENLGAREKLEQFFKRRLNPQELLAEACRSEKGEDV